MKTIGMLSLGCAKNLVDSEHMLGLLAQEGYRISYSVEECDIALLNTCAFVEDARTESLDMLHELKRLKDEGAIKHIVVCGCYPQRGMDEGGELLDCVDGFVGTGDIEKICDVIHEVSQGKQLSKIGDPSYLHTDATPRFFLTPPFVKYVKIAEGCNHYCSFCVIPKLRGVYRSRPIESIVNEVRTLVSHGLKEVNLISQDTSFYGNDLYGKLALPDLLKQLCAIEGLHWIRALYLHPRHITPELITVIKNERKICKYIDIPLQHANNEILKCMKRGITKEQIIELINIIRTEIPEVVIRTAFIVGYPGEGFAEFNELLDFAESMAFERMGAFMYSDEEGSVANSLPEKVEEHIKKSRFQDIMLLQRRISKTRNKKLKNNVFETLIEGYNEDMPEYLIGRSYMDAPEVDGQIYVKKDKSLTVGEFSRVKITAFNEYDLIGKADK